MVDNPNRQHPYVEGLCEHPGEYLRMGDHPDMTGRFVPEDLDPDTLYCLRCEMEVPDFSVEEDDRG